MSHLSLVERIRQFAGALRVAFVTVADTNRPTLDALRKIARTLDEAGWNTPTSPPPLTSDQLERLRDASARLLRPDDLKVIQAVVADRRPLADVAAELNRTPDDLNKQLAQAMADLTAFARETEPTPA